MQSTPRRMAAAVVVLALVAYSRGSFAQVPQTPSQLTVITSGGFRLSFVDLLPEFERTAGIKVTTLTGGSQGNSPNTIAAQLSRGVAADVVVMSKEGLAELIAAGRIVPGSAVDIAQAPLGAAVRAGAAKPDLSSVEAFTQLLLTVKSITFPGSTTGIYLSSELFPRLGVANAVEKKITNAGVAAVARGEAEIAIQPTSELIGVPGTEFAGVLPRDVQYLSVFSAAIVAGSPHADEGRRLIAFLRSDPATTVIKTHGMERASGR